jgi:lysophospholipase L1-like esterase
MGPILASGAPRIKIGASLNLVCDGNSLTAGTGGYPWPSGLREQYPEFYPMTFRNIAQPGHTTLQLAQHGADSFWVDGMTNVLVVWEGTNSIAVNRTAVQAAQDMADYIAARLAAHPWRIVVGTCLPRQTAAGQTETTALNAALDTYNGLLRANYRAWGAKALFDVRSAGSAFNPVDYSMSSFEALAANTGYWTAGETNNHIHLSSAGYTHLIPNFIIPAIKRLPAR